MYHSAEVRWFVEGALREAVFDWFCDGRSLAPESRIDSYLLFPGCETVGVKRRGEAQGQEASFDVKVRRGGIESVRYPNGITGRSACWVKWSAGGAATAAWVRTLDADPHTWIEVDKTRWTRTFVWTGSSVEERPAGVLVDAGCNVELAEVKVEGAAWWSLGLEAFGAPEHVRGHLHRVGTYFFARYVPPYPLHTTHSLAYPAWLNGFVPPHA